MRRQSAFYTSCVNRNKSVKETFQILTNVLQEHSVVMKMLSVSTAMDHIPALVSLDIMEMERIVKVRIFIAIQIQEKNGNKVDRN